MWSAGRGAVCRHPLKLGSDDPAEKTGSDRSVLDTREEGVRS